MSHYVSDCYVPTTFIKVVTTHYNLRYSSHLFFKFCRVTQSKLTCDMRVNFRVVHMSYPHATYVLHSFISKGFVIEII